MKKHHLNRLFIALSTLFLAQSASADPSSYTHANGSTIVDINKADANGLSHNLWKEFNVSANGMVLNNSTEDLVRASGNIPKNGNLDGAAKTILNEVISNKTTSLKGLLEVAGQKADVIIANPNGITCSGCSFINIGRATLTTGTPDFSDGALSGFTVKQGTVEVEGKGLGNTQSYTDLLAETVRINGQITTGSLRAVAGKYVYNRANGMVTPNSGASLFTSAIDVSALGGVTAGVIQLQSTKTGIGVNNRGTLTADAIQISTNGTLSNSGKIDAGTFAATSGGSLTNSGSLTGANVQLVSSGSIANQGNIKATQKLYAIAMGKITNSQKGTMSGAAANQLLSYANSVENHGTLSADGNLIIGAGYAPDSNNVMQPNANAKIINAGTITSAGGVALQATQAVELNTGSLTSKGTTSLSASTVNNSVTVNAGNIVVNANAFSNEGTMSADDQFTITSKNSIVNSGTLKGQTLALNTEGAINGKVCSWLVFCKKGEMSADRITITAPAVATINDIKGTINAQVIELNKSAAE